MQDVSQVPRSLLVALIAQELGSYAAIQCTCWPRSLEIKFLRGVLYTADSCLTALLFIENYSDVD